MQALNELSICEFSKMVRSRCFCEQKTSLKNILRKEISKDALKKKWKWLFTVEEHVMVKILQREGPASWEIVGYKISPGTKQFVFAQLHHIFSFTHCKSTFVRFI